MADSFLEVPVVSHELTPAETYQQLFRSLEVFKAKSDAVFDRVAKRIHVERQRLQGLAGRLHLAQSKIDAITGSCKATTLLSRARYPDLSSSSSTSAKALNGEFDALWSYSQEPVPRHLQRMMPCSPPRGDWESLPRGAEEALELFAFFTDTAHEMTSHKSGPAGNSSKVGLGRSAATMESAADLLLFNSLVVPHLRSTVVDNLKRNNNQSRRPRREEADELEAHQTLSIFDTEKTQHAGAEDFVFRPTLGEVPSFSLPCILPDLPRIADLNWSGPMGTAADLPSIAPSANIGPMGASPSDSAATSSKPALNTPSPPQSTAPPLSTIPSRPTSSSSHRAPSEASRSSRASSEPRSPPSVPNQASPALLLHTPPPVLNLPAAIQQSLPNGPVTAGPPVPSELPDITISSKVSVDEVPLPPPPPPPPPPMPALAPPQPAHQHPVPPPPSSSAAALRRLSSDVAETDMAPPALLPQLDSVRSALMESIRNPSIRLRKTASTGPTGDRGGKGAPSRAQSMGARGGPNNNSFLAEMASSLHMRRLSMQGQASATTAAAAAPTRDNTGTQGTLPAMSMSMSMSEGEERELPNAGSNDSNDALMDSTRKRLQQLPIAHVHEYIKRKSEASSNVQDDDWDSD